MKVFKQLIYVSLVATGSVLLVYSQTSLPNKPYTQWSKSEAETVLNSSAWTSQQEVRIKFDKETQVAAGSYNPSVVSSTAAPEAKTEVNTQMPVDFIFTLRLRSALPIREALVRLKNLNTDIEGMSPEQLAAFDKQTKGLLQCPACTDNYVVTLSSRSKNNPGADAVFSVFKGGRLADLQRYVFIANERGERRPLVYYVAPKVPGDEATFFFPRANEKGEPLLGPENKELLVNLNDNQPNSVSNFRIDVSKLVVNGKVEF